MSAYRLTEEEILAMHSWSEQFQTVRLLRKGDIITAKKFAVIDRKEKEYFAEYEVIVEDGKVLPPDGDYPLSDFKVVYLAASYVASDAPIPTSVSRNLLEYIGEPKEN